MSVEHEGREMVSYRDPTTRQRLGYLLRWKSRDEIRDPNAGDDGLWDVIYCAEGKDETVHFGVGGRYGWEILKRTVYDRRRWRVLPAEALDRAMEKDNTPETDQDKPDADEERRFRALSLAVRWFGADNENVSTRQLFRETEQFCDYLATGWVPDDQA